MIPHTASIKPLETREKAEPLFREARTGRVPLVRGAGRVYGQLQSWRELMIDVMENVIALFVCDPACLLLCVI